MAFTSGAKTLGSSDSVPGLINEIAGGLIASAGGYWTDADAYNAASNPYGWRANGSWHIERTATYALVNGTSYQITKRQTLDFTTAGAADNNIGTVFTAANSRTLGTGDAVFEATPASQFNENSKRALKYENGAEIIYLTLESWNTQIYCATNVYGRGIRIGFSAGWDAVNHVPTSTTYRSSVLIEGNNTTIAGDMNTLQLTYYLWIESNGFVLTAKPEPMSDTYQNSVFIVVERNPNKEYSDGQSNFYAYCAMNYMFASIFNSGNYYLQNIMRPYLYVSAQQSYQFTEIGITYPLIASKYAHKSTADGKVRYIKPIIFNTIDNPSKIAEITVVYMHLLKYK